MITETAKAAWAAAGLPRAEHKDLEKQAEFVAWGTEARDAAGTAAGPVAKRRALGQLTCWLLAGRRVSKSALRSLLANFVHPFVHRRCLLAVFHRSFKFLESLPDEVALVRLPADILDELAVAAALLGVAVGHVRWPVSREVSASDATVDSYGATAARVEGKIARARFVSLGFSSWRVRQA